jgi:type IV pilus assembly protein PilF
MMEETIRFRRGARAARRHRSYGGLCATLLVLVSAGCAPTTVPIQDDFTVSEARAKRDLGVDYLSSGRTAMAIRELRASLELDSSDPDTHLWLGEAYRRKGQSEVAEGYLKEAIELSAEREVTRTEQEARLNLSALLSQMGRFEDALPQCEMLAKDPTVSTPWRPLTNCGYALLQLGRLEEAREHFEEALDYFPRYGPALLNLGILESQEGHRLAAIETLERALGSRLGARGRAEVNYRLGELYVALGRRDKAVEHFRAAAEKAPNLEWGAQSQAYLDLLD